MMRNWPLVAAAALFGLAIGCGDTQSPDDGVDGEGGPQDASVDAKTVDASHVPDAGKKDVSTPPPPVKDASVPDAGDPWLDPTRPGWTLVWRDEFDGPNGASVDSSKWGFDVGGTGWGNQELEYYTSRTQNAHLDGNGYLVIEADAESYSGKDFTSARIKTEGKFEQTYGRFEARALLPSGQGLWPAFWLLASNHKTVGWPDCGEIDVMEEIGSTPTSIRGSLNGPGYSGDTAVYATYGLSSGKTFQGGYHVFIVEWSPGEIDYYVDGELYSKRVPASLPGGTDWVFDGHPFFVIVNLAVGGLLPGSPDDTTPFPARMLVDYVRVYRR